MNIETSVFEDLLHGLTYAVEDDRYWQRFSDIYGMKLDWYADVIHVPVNPSRIEREFEEKHFDLSHRTNLIRETRLAMHLLQRGILVIHRAPISPLIHLF